jgi:O-glycosyl hydrolase
MPRALLIATVCGLLATLACALPTSVVRVDWATARQTIDGFGAASNETSFVEPLSESVMDFFYTTKGIGLSLLRIRDYPSVADCEADSKAGVCVATPDATLLATDLKAAEMAVARGVRVWSSQWSPPGAMKSNGAFMKGGAMIGSEANYRALASLLAGFVTFMASHGVPLHALSPQNEPDMSTWYPSATWTPEQIHDFVPYLYDAFRAAGVTDTKIMIGEQSRWTAGLRFWRDPFAYSAAAMRDPAVAARVGIVAAHNYDHRDPSRPPRVANLTSQRLWQTEVSTPDGFDASMANALGWAQRIHYFLSAARVNAFHFWYLTASPVNKDNQTLADGNGRVARRAYALGQWSRFVRPGWHAVAVRSPRSLLVTAFQNEARSESAIVVVNSGAAAVSDQRFEIGAAMRRTATPWITSEADALVARSPIAIADGAFSYTIPAASIVTFVGQTGSTP